MFSAITIETSYKSTGADMGQNHIKIHEKEHTFLQPGEQEVVTLTDNNLTDDSLDLAKKKAIEMGVRDEADWKKYNASLRRSRRKDSYDEYLAGLSASVVKQLDRHMKDTDLPRPKRAKIAEELAAINKNGGVPIDGSLFYLGNVENYEGMTPDELKTYRQFEKETLTKFFESDLFQTFHPGNFRSELHFDELGRPHLQAQDVWYKKGKAGRVTYAKRAMVKEILEKKFGKKGLEQHIGLLCYYHRNPQKARNGRQIRVDYNYNQSALYIDPDSDNGYKDISNGEKNARILEVWRIEQMNELEKIALETAKKYGVEWKRDFCYKTDGQHLTKRQYQAKMENRRKARENRLKEKKLDNAKKKLSDDYRQAYEDFTGEKAGNLSPLEMSKNINKKVSDAKTKLDSLMDTYTTRKADQDRQLKREMDQERQSRLVQIDEEMKKEKQKRQQKLQERERELDQREQELKQNQNRYNHEKTVLDRTMAMFPAVENYYKTGRFVISSPDNKVFAKMIESETFVNAEKARKYDAQQTYVKRLETAFKKLFKRVYHKVLTDVKMGIKTVLEPPKTVEKEPVAKPDNQNALSKTDKVYANNAAKQIKASVRQQVFDDTPSAEAYEKEAQSVYTTTNSLGKKFTNRPDRND